MSWIGFTSVIKFCPAKISLIAITSQAFCSFYSTCTRFHHHFWLKAMPYCNFYLMSPWLHGIYLGAAKGVRFGFVSFLLFSCMWLSFSIVLLGSPFQCLFYNSYRLLINIYKLLVVGISS